MIEDITYIGLGLGLLLMVVPLYFLARLKTGLVHSTLSAIIRMIVQLYLVGLYLQYLFELDRWYVNLAWGLIMLCVATGAGLQRTNLKPQYLALPLFAGFLISAVVVAFYFLAFVLGRDQLSSLLTARYFIPIFGLLLGNTLSANVIAINAYYEDLKRERQMYFYLLGNGASRLEAVTPFIGRAVVKAFNPCIANMAVMGLVSMPGTMIGQILGGSDPSLAIKYQMMIVVITFVASMVSLMITIALAHRRCFDKMGRLKDVFVSGK